MQYTSGPAVRLAYGLIEHSGSINGQFGGVLQGEHLVPRNRGRRSKRTKGSRRGKDVKYSETLICEGRGCECIALFFFGGFAFEWGGEAAALRGKAAAKLIGRQRLNRKSGALLPHSKVKPREACRRFPFGGGVQFFGVAGWRQAVSCRSKPGAGFVLGR